jgi:hypothetical protein
MQNRVKQEFLADRQIIQRTDDTKTMCNIGLNVNIVPFLKKFSVEN